MRADPRDLLELLLVKLKMGEIDRLATIVGGKPAGWSQVRSEAGDVKCSLQYSCSPILVDDHERPRAEIVPAELVVLILVCVRVRAFPVMTPGEAQSYLGCHSGYDGRSHPALLVELSSWRYAPSR